MDREEANSGVTGETPGVEAGAGAAGELGRIATSDASAA